MVTQRRDCLLAQFAERPHRWDQRLPLLILDRARDPCPDQECDRHVVGRELVAELLDLTPRVVKRHENSGVRLIASRPEDTLRIRNAQLGRIKRELLSGTELYAARRSPSARGGRSRSLEQ